MDLRNLALRVASAVVALPVVAALVLWRNTIGFALLTGAAVALALREYAALTLPGRPRRERGVVVLGGLGLYVGLYLKPDLAALWLVAAVMLVGAVALTVADDIPGAAARLGVGGFGIFYVGGLAAALPLLHRDAPDGRLWVVLAMAVTFVADSGAYFVGHALGRHKLAPAISPGKTVEGGVGGLLTGLGFAFLARATFLPAMSVLDAVLVGLAAGVLGPIGDLVESLVKRAAGVKDSGRLIPGHGGMLDRIDAVLFVGAYVYLHVRLL